jgi:twinkle protein
MDELGRFCELNNIHCFLVAHPTKIRKDEKTGQFDIPNLYNISGSANFFNKTDNGLAVYRDFEANLTKIFIQKVKFSHWGTIGQINFNYDLASGRYHEQNEAYEMGSWIEKNKREMIVNSDFLDIIVREKDEF